MKQYIIIRHDNGSWSSIRQQFDNIEDASAFARLAALGDPGYDYSIYELKENHREGA